MNNLSSALIATAVIIWRCCDADDSFFHLSLMQTTANKAISIVSITSESQAPTPLCLPLPLPQPRSVDQLAHLVCRQAGFPTFTSSALLPRNILHREADQGFNLTCNLKEGLSLHCTANRTNSTCSSIIQVDCGACSFHRIVKSNSTLKISSPLYPVLLPGLSCFWQLEVGDGTKVVLEDLSLSHCSSSYLSFNSRGTLLAHLCGEKAGLQFTVRGRQLQILLESGRGNNGRGFRATVTVPPIILRRRSTSMMAGGVVMVALALAIFLTTFVLVRRGQARRRRACRHASTWRGPAPAGGGRTTAQIARASTLNQLPPPSYSFAIRQLPALPSPLPEEEVLESTRMELQRESSEASKIYESPREVNVVSLGSGLLTPPPRPLDPTYLSLEGSGLGKVKLERNEEYQNSRLASLHEGLRRLSSKADIFHGRIRSASCAEDDEVILCSIVHNSD